MSKKEEPKAGKEEKEGKEEKKEQEEQKEPEVSKEDKEQKELEERKSKPLVQGDYVIQVHVIEGRELKGRGLGDMSDPVCVVTVMGQRQQTRIHKKSLNPLFDQVLVFEFKNAYPAELERASITLSVNDANTFRKDVMIGLFQFDVASVYFNKNHEIFRQWVALTDVTDKHEGIQGYLRASVVVLGPGDEQFIHSAAEEDDDGGGMLSVLMPPSIEQKGRLLKLSVYEAQNLPKMDEGPIGGDCDPYVRVDFGGLVTKTKHLEGLNPVFCTQLQVPVMEPVMSSGITVSVWDWDRTSSDDRIATFRLDYKEISKQPLPPTWFNLYGAPELMDTGEASKMNKAYVEGSYYRGRVLISAEVIDDEEPKQDVVAIGPPEPKPVEDQYVVQLDIYEGSEIPDLAKLSKGKVKIELFWGKNSSESTTAKVEGGRCKWYCVLKDVIATWPRDLAQVPDVFVYLVCEKKRISYKRFPATALLAAGWKVPPVWHVFTECKALDGLDDDEFPGSVLFSIRAGPLKEAPAKPFPESRPLRYEQGPTRPRASAAGPPPGGAAGGAAGGQPPPPAEVSRFGDLTVQVIDGSNLPAVDRGGTSDPYVKLQVGEEKWKTGVQKKTLSPVWNETYTFKSVAIDAPLLVEVMDKDTAMDEKMGECSVDVRGINIQYGTLGRDFTKEQTFLISPKNPTAQIKLKISFKYASVEMSKQLEKQREEKKIKESKTFFGQISKVADTIKGDISGAAPVSDELGTPSFASFQLRVHLYLARSLPATDANGLSDPYIVFRLGGNKIVSAKKRETLNPHWFTSYTAAVSLPIPLSLAPNLLVAVFDWDQLSKDDNVGRFSVTCEEIVAMNPSLTELTPKWFHLRNWEGEEIPDAKVLCSFQLLTSEEVGQVGPLPKIAPPTKQMFLEVVTMGLRDLQSTLGVHKTYLDFELPNGQRFGTNASQLPQAKNPNFLQVLKIPIDVPLQKIFAPTLNVEVRDLMFGGLVKRLIGAASLDLTYFMEDDGEGGWRPAAVQKRITSDQEVADELAAEKAEAERKAREEALKKAVEEEAKRAQEAEAKRIQAEKDEEEREAAEDLKFKQQQNPPASQRLSQAQDKPVAVHVQAADVRKTSAGGASGSGSASGAPAAGAQGDQAAQAQGAQGAPEEQKEQEPKPADAVIDVKEGGGKKEEQGKNEDDDLKNEKCERVDVNAVDPADEEDVPFYLKGRLTVDDELEDNMAMNPFDKVNLFTGQKNAGKFGDKYRQVGLFKGLVRLTETQDAPPVIDTGDLLVPKDLYVRLYVLRGYKLMPKDNDGKSDPYLVVKLGKEKVSTRSRYIRSTLDPEFYESFEFPCQIPGASQLEITVMDWDGLGDDFIGKTVIDIEDRWFTKEWRKLDLKPLERRTLHSPVSLSPQGKLELWVEILQPEVAKRTPMVDIKPPPPTPFELRVIVWSCKDCPIKDEITKQNDLYVTCHCSVPGLKRQETDVHYRSKNQKGNFNWRMKFPLGLPVKPWPRLRFQIWDKDFFSANDSICERVISIKGLCKKALKKKDRVKIVENGNERIKLTGMKHPNFPNDQPATCELSIELIPEDQAKQLPAGFGRSDPNANPFLPPPEGRVNWSLFHPLDMLKELLGPELYRKIWCACICIVLLAALGACVPLITSNVIGKAFSPW